ncbi:MAG: hypothetical protein CME62_01350 [Halobacteriovoraceae bacterium]|nr:hypothetical protein [Halobacteriovoraceae bacterium]|tara:strand:+ start:84 stop:2456 length:2373 start_codon:yes stop_codon:yes gene_type:complete
MTKKILTVSAIVVLVVALAVLGILRSKVPSQKGEKAFSQIEHPVSTYFDKYGIPHIESQSSESAYFALGYHMASERLFQMDLYRRLVQGRLSEIIGEKTIESDKLLRTLGFKQMGENMLKNISPQSEIMILAEAYLEGVHAFIKEGNLPIEFLILNYHPEPFSVSDMIGLTGYMALTFTEGINQDVFLSELAEKLPEQKLQSLRVKDSTDRFYFQDQKTVFLKTLENVNKAFSEISKIAPILHGSNSWVLAGSRTKSGFPVLANDPHIGISNPHIFFEAHLKIPNFELYGNYIPLMAFPVMGHTRETAWALTMSEVDDFNVYLEKINPDNPNEVMFNNEWTELDIREEVIKVKGQKPVKIVVKTSPHGPLLDNTEKGVSDKSLSVSWSVHHPENNALASIYGIPRANTVEEFKTAVSHAAAPGLNISWVHKRGDIAWWMLGKNPKLPEGVKTDLVLKGWDGSEEIERYYSVDENPHQVNPERGIIITANYRPQLEEFSHFQGYWQPGGRYFRLEKLLASKTKWSLEELKKIQFDNKVPIGDQLKEQMLEWVNRENFEKLDLEILDYLKEWDGECLTSSVGCSVYHVWNYFNTLGAFQDEMGEKGFKKFGKSADFFHVYKNLMFRSNDSLWDNVETKRVESGKDIVTQSFFKMKEYLVDTLGIRVSKWHWGKIHTTEYVHPLGRVKPLNIFFNIGPVPAAGGRYVINNMGHKKELLDFRAVHAPATRRLIDIGDVDRTLGIMPTGNSGNLMSPHYSDQLKLYHAGKYRTQLMDWSYIRGLHCLRFVPATVK